MGLLQRRTKATARLSLRQSVIRPCGLFSAILKSNFRSRFGCCLNSLRCAETSGSGELSVAIAKPIFFGRHEVFSLSRLRRYPQF